MVAKEITGRVVKLDELHFEVADDADRRHRFFVSMDAAMEAGDLAQLERDGTRIVVLYDDDTPHVAVAHRVFRAPPSPPGG